MYNFITRVDPQRKVNKSRAFLVELFRILAASLPSLLISKMLTVERGFVIWLESFVSQFAVVFVRIRKIRGKSFSWCMSKSRAERGVYVLWLHDFNVANYQKTKNYLQIRGILVLSIRSTKSACQLQLLRLSECWKFRNFDWWWASIWSWVEVASKTWKSDSL